MALNDIKCARDVASRLGVSDAGERFRLESFLLEAFAAIRADEREKCAQVAEGGRCEMPRNPATTEGAGAYVQNATCRSIAAAIRARGSE